MSFMVIQMSTRQHMSNQVKPKSSIPAVVIAVALVLVVVAVAVAAYIMFGPQPEPHGRYNTAELVQKAQKNINSLTPDERRVYDHITHADGTAPKFHLPQPTQAK